MLYSTPIAAIVMMREVFPELTSGSGRPVGGMEPLTTSALMTTWIAYTAVMPDAVRKPNISLHRAAVRIPQKTIAPNTKKAG